MTDITTHAIHTGALRARFDRFVATLAERLNAYGETRSRRREIQALESLSDAELATIGLKRRDIVRYVFRDLFYI